MCCVVASFKEHTHMKIKIKTAVFMARPACVYYFIQIRALRLEGCRVRSTFIEAYVILQLTLKSA